MCNPRQESFACRTTTIRTSGVSSSAQCLNAWLCRLLETKEQNHGVIMRWTLDKRSNRAMMQRARRVPLGLWTTSIRNTPWPSSWLKEDARRTLRDTKEASDKKFGGGSKKVAGCRCSASLRVKLGMQPRIRDGIFFFFSSYRPLIYGIGSETPLRLARTSLVYQQSTSKVWIQQLLKVPQYPVL